MPLNDGGMLGGLSGPGIIQNVAKKVLPRLFDKLFGGAGQSIGRLPLPQRPQGEITNPTKIGTFEETFGAPPPGFVYDEQGFLRNTDPNDNGYYINGGGTPIAATPPLVPVPKPTTAGGGGASSGGGGGSSSAGDIEDILNPDPDLTGGGFPETGTGSPEPGSGPTPADQPPVERSADEWYDIIDDWFIRFPNVSRDEAIAAGQSVGVPANILNDAIDSRFDKPTPDPASPFGTGSTTSGNGSGGSTGGSGSSGTVGGSTGAGGTTQTPSTGTGGGSGGGTGTGTGSGSGTGTGNFTGMLSQTPMTDELFAEDLWRMKTPQAKVLDSLLTYGYNPGMFSPFMGRR